MCVKVTYIYRVNYLKAVILLFMLSMNGVTAFAADTDEIIEFRGDRYVIHVDRMKPDSTMTLLDVLNTCPEFLSVNGKKIDLNYIFRVDNIALVMDATPPQSSVHSPFREGVGESHLSPRRHFRHTRHPRPCHRGWEN